MKDSLGARGFSMLEVLVVIGMFAIVAGFGLFVSMETYRGSNFHSDRNLLVAVLERARAQSINNLCYGTCTDGKKHGVYVDDANKKYVIFQGDTYNAADPINSAFDSDQSSTRTFSGNITSQYVVFDQLTGKSSTDGTITLSEGGRTSVIMISTEGQITWTN